MRKLVLSIITALASTSFLLASHLLGGELKLWTDTVNGQYAVMIELRLVRDATGIPLPQYVGVDVQDTGAATSTLPLALQPGTGPGNFIYPPTGVNIQPQFELYVYSGYYIPTNPNAYINVVYLTCCRPNGIDNIINSGSEGYYISADLDLSVGSNSELPVITPMAAYVNVNQPFSISHFTQDLDGDSLYFNLKTPLHSDGTPVGIYSLPWDTIINPLPFQVDANIGFVTGYAMNLALVAYRIEIEEYRMDSTSNQYELIAKHNKDLAIQSVGLGSNSSANLATIPGSTTLPNGAQQVEFIGGQNNQVTLSFNSISTEDFSIEVYGGPFDFDALNTSVVRDSSSPTTCNYHFSWNPGGQYVSNQPYYFVVRIMHYGFPYDMLMAISVNSSIGIDESSVSTFKIVPNPVNSLLFIDSSVKWEKVEIVGLSGEIIYQSNYSNGQIDVSGLPGGMYFVKLYKGSSIGVERFVKL